MRSETLIFTRFCDFGIPKMEGGMAEMRLVLGAQIEFLHEIKFSQVVHGWNFGFRYSDKPRDCAIGFGSSLIS